LQIIYISHTNDVANQGRGTIPLTHEEESLFVRHTHLVSERIKNDRQLTEDNLRTIKSLFPDVYSVLTKIQPEEAFSIFERYKDHPFFCKDVEILLSPKGRECVARELEMIKEHAKGS
jgi:hypothetical protein